MNKEQFLALLGSLGGDGIYFIQKKDGTIAAVNSDGLKKHRNALRKRRHRAKKKAAGSGTKCGQNVDKTRTTRHASRTWNGITWMDAPGHDETAKKLNFFELIRGTLKGYEHCTNLHGDALRAEFARINAGQKAKSQKAAAKRTEEAEKRRAASQAT